MLFIWFVLELLPYILAFVFIPIAIHENYLLYRWRNEMWIQKRCSLSSIYGLNASLCFCIVAKALVSFAMIRTPSRSVLQFVLIVSNNIGMWTQLYYVVLKNWLLYYRYFWTKYTMQSKWSQLINANMNPNANWFIRNYRTFGNLSYCRKLFAPVFVAAFLLFSIGSNLPSYAGFTVWSLLLCMVCMVCSYVAILVFYTYIVCKTPSVDDPFFMHWESKKIAIALALQFLTFFLAGALTIEFRLFPLIMVSAQSTHLLMHYVGSTAIRKRNTSQVASLPLLDRVMAESASRGPKDETKPKLSPSPSPSNSTANLTLNAVLENEQALHVFMEHLSKEYSMECLLSLIEIMQFQQYILDHCNIDMDAISEARLLQLQFAQSVPASSIIEEEENYEGVGIVDKQAKLLYAVQVKAYKIFEKYVAVDSEFEINISSAQRKKISDLVDDYQQWIATNVNMQDLLLMFEPCKVEVYSHLLFSLHRLRSTPNYPVMNDIFVISE